MYLLYYNALVNKIPNRFQGSNALQSTRLIHQSVKFTQKLESDWVPRGQPKKRWLDGLREDFKIAGITEREAEYMARDRRLWSRAVYRLLVRVDQFAVSSINTNPGKNYLKHRIQIQNSTIVWVCSI